MLFFCFYDVKNPAVFVKHSSIQKKKMAEIKQKTSHFGLVTFMIWTHHKKMSIVIRDERSEVTQTYETETNQRLESSLSLNVDTVLSNQKHTSSNYRFSGHSKLFKK